MAELISKYKLDASAPILLVPTLVALILIVTFLNAWWLVPQYGGVAYLGFLAVVAAIVILVRPVVGVYILVLSFPISQILELFGGEVTWSRFVGVLVFGVWVLQKLMRRDSWGRLSSVKVVAPAMLFVVFASASGFWAKSIPPEFTRLFTIIQLLAFTLMTVDLIYSQQRLDWVLRFLVLGGILASSLTISQGLLDGVRRAGNDIGGHTNHTAIILVAILPIAFYLVRVSKDPKWWLVGAAYIPLSGVAVALTFSRMSYVMLPLVLGTQLFMIGKSGRRALFMLLLISAIGAVIISQAVPWDRVLDRVNSIGPALQGSGRDPAIYQTTDVQTLSARVGIWLGALLMFADHPLLGVGHSNYRRQYLETYQFKVPPEYQLLYTDLQVSEHSTLLGNLAELGVIGVILYLWLFVVGVQNLRQSLSADLQLSNEEQRVRKLLVPAVFVSLLAYLMYSFVDVIQYHKVFWLLLAITEVLRRRGIGDTKEMGMNAIQLRQAQ